LCSIKLGFLISYYTWKRLSLKRNYLYEDASDYVCVFIDHTYNEHLLNEYFHNKCYSDMQIDCSCGFLYAQTNWFFEDIFCKLTLSGWTFQAIWNKREQRDNYWRTCAVWSPAGTLRKFYGASSLVSMSNYKLAMWMIRVQAMQRDYKLSSYSLNSVSAHFLGEQVLFLSFVIVCLVPTYVSTKYEIFFLFSYWVFPWWCRKRMFITQSFLIFKMGMQKLEEDWLSIVWR
jgi:hypothetical protein